MPAAEATLGSSRLNHPRTTTLNVARRLRDAKTSRRKEGAVSFTNLAVELFCVFLILSRGSVETLDVDSGAAPCTVSVARGDAMEARGSLILVSELWNPKTIAFLKMRQCSSATATFTFL